MLQAVTIQNFKSLRDITVNLQKVNLLIGPNNSGKSNFLKAISFIKEHFNYRIQPSIVDLNRIYFNQNSNKKNPILFNFQWSNPMPNVKNTVYQLELLGYSKSKHLQYNELIGKGKKVNKQIFKLAQIDRWIENLVKFNVIFEGNASYMNGSLANLELKKLAELDDLPDSTYFRYLNGQVLGINRMSFSPGDFLKKVDVDGYYLPFDLREALDSIKIYKPDPSKISKENILLFDQSVNEDCSNLVAFLDNMRDGHPKVWNAIEKDLNKCLPDFEGIGFDKVTITGTLNVSGRQDFIGKRFGLRDKFGKTYWAEELSEGTIYFLALLAIIHQPNPPKILLLEEPEKGIHPRRISEVMDLIFRLAEEKDIQIIITSHSTQVVDEFQDIPESVFVFESHDGETKIKNLLTDIIEPDNRSSKEKGYPKLDFTKHTLGEHWAIGYLGGVPTK